MCLFQYEDDPEPEEQIPAGPLFVPARSRGTHQVVRLFRTPLGARTAVGFTSRDRLVDTLGTAQPWIWLSEAALRATAEPLGVSLLTVDPTLTAPPVTAPPVTATATTGPVAAQLQAPGTTTARTV
ncbi:SAV_915 family protein [Streptomyces hundungensis]|uniref:SAV_915 family protein n=1 Tax=Streptomyces hundungensis TaxID=1077946 RepID=UPI0033F9BCEE